MDMNLYLRHVCKPGSRAYPPQKISLVLLRLGIYSELSKKYFLEICIDFIIVIKEKINGARNTIRCSLFPPLSACSRVHAGPALNFVKEFFYIDAATNPLKYQGRPWVHVPFSEWFVYSLLS